VREKNGKTGGKAVLRRDGKKFSKKRPCNAPADKGRESQGGYELGKGCGRDLV